MTTDWHTIVELLPFIYKDNINTKELKDVLTYAKDYDLPILDRLYMRGLLDKEDYIYLIERLMKNKEEDISFLRWVRDNATKEDDYSPMTHYSCCACRN